jgi:hypothetical protein
MIASTDRSVPAWGPELEVSMRTRIAGMLVFLGIAATAFFLTRVARLDVRYAAERPIEDRAVLDRLSGPEAREDAVSEGLIRRSDSEAETLYLPPIPVLKLLSLGHPWALSDLVFVRAHSYVLGHFFSDRVFPWLDAYCEAMVGLDPDNPKIYLWAAQVQKFGQKIDDDVIRRANRFLSAGIERFPRDWRLHEELGFNLYFEFQGESPAEKAEAKARGAEHFTVASQLPNSSVDPNLVAVLIQRGREDRVALAYALQKYFEATEDQRVELGRRIATISAEIAAQVQSEEHRWKKEMPFVPISLYSLLDSGKDGGAGDTDAASGSGR